MITDGAAATRDIAERAEVVVVGSGAGGAVVARELAEAGRDVVVLEEGGHYTGKDFTGDPRTMIDLLYRQRGLTGSVAPLLIPIPLGCCVGGTTVINSGTCYRAPDYVLEEWAERYGVRDILEPVLRPHFERVEATLGVGAVPDQSYGRNSRLFEHGAARLGYAGARIPRNAPLCLGTGVCVLGCPQDAKQAMHVSYIPRALAAGARLYARCRVTRILVDRGRAYGVSAELLDAHGLPTGRQLHAVAQRVVAACGALLTPALLARSGLRHPWLGRNLHIHPATRIGALFDGEVRGWEGVPQAYNVHQFTREGIFIQGMFVPPGLEAMALPGVGRAHKERMARFSRLASFGALISDESAGRVRPRGAAWPLVTYSLGRRDLALMLRAIAITAEVFFAAGAREVFSGIASRPVVRSAAEARALAGAPVRASEIALMAFHPQGTCRMGEDGARAVCDSYGRVRGVRGLAVADASLFPSSCRVNPQITIMAVAARIARQIDAELG